MSASKLDLVLRFANEEEKQAALTFQAVQNDYLSAEKDLESSAELPSRICQDVRGVATWYLRINPNKGSPLISHTNRYFDRTSACCFEVKTCSR